MMNKQKINMTLGRFQPMTKGHLNMINEGDAPCIIYRINSTDKLPETLSQLKVENRKVSAESIQHVIDYINTGEGELTHQEKELLKRPFTNELIEKELDIVKKSNKNIVDVVSVKNMFDALDRFNAFCSEHPEYEPQYWMCGDDRVDNYSNIIGKYDELETSLGSKQIIKNILKGKLTTNIGSGRSEGVSGTAVRQAIINNDKSAFSKLMPTGVDSMFSDFKNAFDEFSEKLKKLINVKECISLKDFVRMIEEKLVLNKSTKDGYQPKDKFELKNLVEKLLDERGKDADLNDIDTSAITDMSYVFYDLDPHDIDISEWDVSNVTDMSCMFWSCEKFNSDLSSWNVSNVKSMRSMFYECKNFNCDLNQWDVSNVKNMYDMFCGCVNFNSDISSWDVNSVINMERMFSKCRNFNSDLSDWDVSNVENMSCMFWGCEKFNSDLSSWDVNKVEDMYAMFARCVSLKNKPKWYVQ